ncbi:hypothetical protein ACHJH3_06695 [Campylobacter sp. MOP7]|uniref:hypothetical protein n=1 Tax=Campylobacter canis TaxID=3378588 RepID=UPI00387E2461
MKHSIEEFKNELTRLQDEISQKRVIAREVQLQFFNETNFDKKDLILKIFKERNFVPTSMHFERHAFDFEYGLAEMEIAVFTDKNDKEQSVIIWADDLIIDLLLDDKLKIKYDADLNLVMYEDDGYSTFLTNFALVGVDVFRFPEENPLGIYLCHERIVHDS